MTATTHTERTHQLSKPLQTNCIAQHYSPEKEIRSKAGREDLKEFGVEVETPKIAAETISSANFFLFSLFVHFPCKGFKCVVKHESGTYTHDIGQQKPDT